MNCDHVEESLLDYVEGQLDADASRLIKSHLDECPPCRMAHRDTKELLGAIHVAKDVQERALSRSLSTAAARAAQPGAAPAWSPGSRLGDFDILDLIGRGGMGAVYRARQVSLNRIVALKILPAGLSQSAESLTRFRREAQAAAKLHHTNIVPVYAQGEQEGHFYYAMEMIEGVDLGRVLKTDPGRLYQPTMAGAARSPSVIETDAPDSSTASQISIARPRADYRRLARLIAQVADALSHAHRQNVLHRDIKPQNLLLGADGQLHITDFGLARLLDEPSMTVTGEMLGTPAYMSPEQIDADRSKIDHRTDIYSLGVTLYELLTGQRPFDGPTREQTIARIRNREPKPPRKLNSHVPIDLETICLRAMEKEPKRRYANAADMAADLIRYASDKPILSRRVNPLEKAVKWVRRHPAMTTIISLSVLLALVATLWSIQSARSRREKANDLVRQAYESLTVEDYRDPLEPPKLLALAEPLGPDPARLEVAKGLSIVIDRPGEAIKLFESALNRNPADFETMYLLAWACRMDQQLDAYEGWIAKADSLSAGKHDAFSYFFRGLAVISYKPEEAIANLRSATGLRERFYQAMLQLGRALNYQMYHDRTVEYFGEITNQFNGACGLSSKAYPRYLFSIAYRIAGEIYRDTGNAERAKTNFDLALKQAKDAQDKENENPRGYIAEAEYWETLEEYKDALRLRDIAFEKLEAETRIAKITAKSARAEKIEFFDYRWRVAYWLGLLDRAESDLRGFVEAKGQSTDPALPWRQYFFPALILADRGKTDEAADRALKMAAAKPDDFRSVTSAACLLQILGRPDDAVAILESTREKVRFDLAASGTRTKEWYEALYDYCRATKNWTDLEALAADLLEPTPGEDGRRVDIKLHWPEAHFFRACRELSHGRRDEAFEAFEACDATYDYEHYCYLARVFVRKMNVDPSWPSWAPKR